MTVIKYEKELQKHIEAMDEGDKSAASRIIELVYLCKKKDDLHDLYDQVIELLEDYCNDDNNEEKSEKIAGLFDENSEIMYYFAVELEQDRQMKKAICLYYIAALYGCKKAEYTLMNMGNRESMYFIKTNDHTENYYIHSNAFFRGLRLEDAGLFNEDTELLFEQGKMYDAGEQVKRSIGKAFYYYYIAASRGDKNAQYELGCTYLEGKVVYNNYEEGLKWLRKSAAQGHASAQNDLGFCYFKGMGVKKDERKSLEWYQKAADKGHADAQWRLGYCYETGKGVEVDHEKAVEWYQKAADKGYADAQFCLGRCYQYGKGIEVDHEKAVEWYQKAIAGGSDLAKTYFFKDSSE